MDGGHGTVIDPYAGSGTTLVAAEIMGLSWLGIEISPEYIEMAKGSLTNAEDERPRVEAEIALHRVTKTFNPFFAQNTLSGNHFYGHGRVDSHI